MDSFKEILGTIRGWVKKISPPLPVGGLQVTDSALRYARIKGGNMISASLQLQPGTVENGKIKNRDAFVAALKELHHRVPLNPRKTGNVVLSLPVNDVFIQTFSMPRVAEANFDEAASLNASMVSPVDVENSYYGWQKLDEKLGSSNEINLLGAFVLRSVADNFIVALEEANFGIAAVEFSSMSIARDIASRKIIPSGQPYVAAEITAEGINLMVASNNVPYFHYLNPWSEIQGESRTISSESFRNTLYSELNRIVNFYSTHWSGSIKDIVIITPSLVEEVKSLAEEKFKGMNVRVISPHEASAVVGAATRGLIPRSEDFQISLASLTALGVFKKKQLINFVRIWRNAFAVILGLLLAVFVVVDIFVVRELNRVTADMGSLADNPDVELLNSLKSDAGEFNSLVSSITKIKSGGYPLSLLFSKISELAGSEVFITRVGFTGVDSPVAINGIVPNEEAAIRFKNVLASQPQFTGVNLPFSNISSQGNSVSFSLTLMVRSLEFD